MKVTQRLYIAALPSAVGVLTVAALAYWGQYARAIPEIFVWIAALATVGTFFLSWSNVRYVARRVERLAHNADKRDANGAPPLAMHSTGIATLDELDMIEGTVSDLSGAVRSAQQDRFRELERSTQRSREQTEVLAIVSTSALQRLDEVRLPLHILLENHFGDLNENQEEMLGAARAASEVMDEELQAVAELAGLELGSVVLRRDRVFPADILNAILPTLRAHTTAQEVELQADIAPLVPAVHVDAARIQRALLVLLSECIRTSEKGTMLTLVLAADRGAVTVRLSPATAFGTNARTLLARRVIEATDGSAKLEAGTFTIRLPN